MRFDEPLRTKPVWRAPEQREAFVQDMLALSNGAWDEMRANENAAVWRLTFGGDPDLHLEICRRRKGAQ
jgi:hypothetical protein